MGFCCGAATRDPDIDKCNSLDEIIEVMKKKQENLLVEAEQIQKNIDDPNEKITIVDMENKDPETKKRRVTYVKDLEECYKSATDLLEANKEKLPFAEAKEHILTIVGNYYVAFDDTKKYAKDLENLNEFASKYTSQ